MPSLSNRNTPQQHRVASLSGGCLCHAFPWLAVMGLLVSWANAPQEACSVERKGWMRNKLESFSTCPVATHRYPESLTFPLGPRAARQEGRQVSILGTFHRAEGRYKTEQKQTKQNKRKLTLSEIAGFFPVNYKQQISLAYNS